VARLFLFFTLLPLVDLYVLVQIGGEIGFLPTLIGVILVGMVGAALARHEGFRVLRQWQAALAEGRVPDEGVLGGMLALGGGALLVMPGVLSDVVGLLLLFPPTRKLVAAAVRRRLERSMAEGSVRVYGAPGMGDPFGGMPRPAPPRGPRTRPGGPVIIDVEGEVIEQDGERRLR
jgi:UPF0716 protein FxsA